MPRSEAARSVPARQAAQERAPAAVSPVSVSSHAAVEASGRLQALAARCAAHLQGLACPETTKLMLAWLDGYEAATRTEVTALREQIRMVAGDGQTATAKGSAPSPTHQAQVSRPPTSSGVLAPTHPQEHP